jgi:hypothetical protein
VNNSNKVSICESHNENGKETAELCQKICYVIHYVIMQVKRTGKVSSDDTNLTHKFSMKQMHGTNLKRKGTKSHLNVNILT